MTDPIVDAVKADLDARSARGVAKYGVTLARTDLTHAQWTRHAYEECLDLALYLRRMLAEPRGVAHWQRLADYARGGAEKPVQADTLRECGEADSLPNAASGQETGQSGHVCAGCGGKGAWWTSKAARPALVSCLDCGGTGRAR